MPEETPATDSRPYSLRPLHPLFGAEVHGINLKSPPSQDVLEQIKDDLLFYRMLVFKDQDGLSGMQQISISKLLGEIECNFEKHPRSPDPQIFCVSNDRSRGFTRIGRSGWHIDGSHQMKPFAYLTMHFPSVVEGGDTLFMPLQELLAAQETDVRTRWEQLWMVSGYGPVHPLVCNHPERLGDTMCFHLGKNYCADWILGDPDSSDAQQIPAKEVREELTRAIWKQPDLMYRQKWDLDDFAIIDNRALAHFADTGTQVHPSKGLRILHRTTIAGEKICTSKIADRCSFWVEEHRKSVVPGPRATRSVRQPVDETVDKKVADGTVEETVEEWLSLSLDQFDELTGS